MPLALRKLFRGLFCFYKRLTAGFFPKNEVHVAGDTFIAGGKEAMVHLGKAVTFLFVHLELDITSVFYYVAEVEISIIW